MAFVHLFEWSWEDVAKECEDFLGPKGFTAVQVSPHQEHMQGSQWWTRYQPVSYNIGSRSGDEASFLSMVSRCKAAGVGIYVDAVINHMAAGGGTGVAGTSYGNRTFPGTYSQSDFHHTNGDKSRNCMVSNYNDKWNVQRCDLVGLTDLCTGCTYVQETIAGYLNRMADLGVAGFRIDAAKHIDAGELKSILSRVDSRLWRFLEVIGAPGEAVQPSMYEPEINTEFGFAYALADAFVNSGRMGNLRYMGDGLMDSNKAINFVDNHDTQRGHAGQAALTHKLGPLYNLASVFMLAHPYGYPSIMSSYYFDDTDAGPPSQRVHTGSGLNCFYGKPWTCEHRWSEIANMVGWRRSAGNAWVEKFETHGSNRISFCRGGRACVLFNREGNSPWQASVSVSMPDGIYCDVQKSDGADCETVSVQNGRVSVTVAAMKAVAFHVGKQR